MNLAGFDFSNIKVGDILTNLSAVFETESLENLARDTCFIERSSSRLSGWMFLHLHLLMEESGQDWSLNEMCEHLYAKFSVQMSKQALDKRFNASAAAFIKACFELVLKQMIENAVPASRHDFFDRVVLTDSTSFQLPCQLADFYKGNGGSNSGASVKIHQQYDLLSGSVMKLQVGDGKQSDALFLDAFDYQHSDKELHLMDLGYYKIAHLKALDQAQGYFISRYKTGTTVYIKQQQGYKSLDWKEFLTDCESGKQMPEVYLGKEKVKVRLIVQKLPEEVVQKRRAKLKAQVANQSKQRKSEWRSSAEKEHLLGFNIFVTNTLEEQLTAGQVQLYYKLRWQIELLFKIWKSILQIDKVGKMKRYRFECYLYSRLLVLLLSTQVQSLLKSAIEDDFELSEWKAMKFLKKG